MVGIYDDPNEASLECFWSEQDMFSCPSWSGLSSIEHVSVRDTRKIKMNDKIKIIFNTRANDA